MHMLDLKLHDVAVLCLQLQKIARNKKQVGFKEGEKNVRMSQFSAHSETGFQADVSPLVKEPIMGASTTGDFSSLQLTESSALPLFVQRRLREGSYPAHSQSHSK